MFIFGILELPFHKKFPVSHLRFAYGSDRLLKCTLLKGTLLKVREHHLLRVA